MYNATNRKFGYNIDPGGKLTAVSAEVKKKMIEQKQMRPITCFETGVKHESQADISNMEGRGHS